MRSRHCAERADRPASTPVEGVCLNTPRVLIALLLLAWQLPALAQDSGSQELAVIDLRPKEEREGFGLAPLEGKCNEDVFRIADVATDPLKIEVLKSDLAPVLGMEGKTLTVLNWSIYYNKQVQYKGSKLEGVGIQGYGIPAANKKKKSPGSKCPQKDSAGGWYLGEELKSVYFPIISEFEGTFAGKPIKVRVVYSPRSKLTGKFEGAREDTDALLEAVHQTVEAVATAALQ